MSQTPTSRPNVRFGSFEVDFEEGELHKQGVRIDLQEQPFRLLSILLGRPGHLVTRDELRSELWPADTFVDFDASLNSAVLKIRQALGDSAIHPRFIETVPRRGYRFLAPVEPASPYTPTDPESQLTAPAGNAANISDASRPRRLLLLVSVLAPALVVGSLLLLLARKVERPNPAWNTRPLTRFAGMEWGPSWSPDGRFIAFARNSSGNANVFVMPMEGGEAIQLTRGEADNIQPRWSPDGRHIAFLSDDGRTKKVFLIPPLGGARQLLAETNIPYLERFVESWQSLGAQPWSPDGREIVFSRLRSDGTISVWKLDLNTKQESPVTSPASGCDDLFASWSFDGKWIAFTRRENGQGGLWLVTARGGDARVILRDTSDNNNPAWSRDSRKIVFESNRGGPPNIWEIALESGRIRQVTNGAGADLDPRVGPSGGMLYVRDIQELSLYRMDVETAKEQRLTSNTSRNYWPRFSPDGRRIAYHSNFTGNWDVWLLDLDTKLETRLTNHPAADLGPEWSPDGRRIAFLSNRDRIFQLWVLDVIQGTTSRLLPQELLAPAALSRAGGAELPAHRWSPDGRKIGFLTAGEKGATLWSADSDGQNAHPVLSGILTFDWYRDSRHVVYTRVAPDNLSTRELTLMDLEDRSEVVLYRGPHVDVTATNDGSAVLFAKAASHFYQDLFVLPLRRPAHGLPKPLGEPKRLTNGRGLWHVHNGAWSADAKTVLYARDAVEADIYLIENYR